MFAKMTTIRPRTPSFLPYQSCFLPPPIFVRRWQTMARRNRGTKGSLILAIWQFSGGLQTIIIPSPVPRANRQYVELKAAAQSEVTADTSRRIKFLGLAAEIGVEYHGHMILSSRLHVPGLVVVVHILVCIMSEVCIYHLLKLND